MKLATKVLPGQQSLETAAIAGFRAVEFWTNGELLSQAKDITDVAQKFDLEYVIHFPNGGKLSSELLQNAADMYAALGCRAMVIHKPMHDRYAEELLSINPELRLGVENLKLTPSQFDQWADREPWLTLDVEHLWKFTLVDAPLCSVLDKLESFLAAYKEKLVHVHMPGYLPGQGEHRPMYCSRELVLECFSRFEDAGYQDFVVSEINPEFQTRCDLQMDVLLAERWRQIRTETNAAN